MKIPRKFEKVYGEMLVDTSINKAGDKVCIERNEYNELISTNERTGEKGLVFNSHMRNPEIFKPTKVIPVKTMERE